MGRISEVVLAILCLIHLVTPLTELACKNQHGDPVDWFLIYKLPDINEHPSPLVQEGQGFLYMDQFSNGWTLSEKSINSTKQALGYTLKQIYLKKNDNAYKLLYNDQAPGKRTNNHRGHTKGVQLFNPQTGFWLIHSVPLFPDKDNYGYPESGTKFGQSMLCISFETDAVLETIAQQLFLNQPAIYDSNLPARMGQNYPTLAKVIAGKSARKAPFNNRVSISSKGGRIFTSFAKHRKWGQDLYSDFVAPSLQESIYVETWLNGPGDLPSVCNQEYTVHNLRTVDPAAIQFTSSKDHSKWAVSLRERDPWVCIGDINRQKSQESRGGGTMCFKDLDVWKLYRQSAERVEECPSFSSSAAATRPYFDYSDVFNFGAEQMNPEDYLREPRQPRVSKRQKRHKKHKEIFQFGAHIVDWLGIQDFRAMELVETWTDIVEWFTGDE